MNKGNKVKLRGTNMEGVITETEWRHVKDARNKIMFVSVAWNDGTTGEYEQAELRKIE